MFDFDRFLKVCHEEWNISWRSYFRLMGIILGIILGITAFRIFNSGRYFSMYWPEGSDPLSAQIKGFFWMGLAIYACIAASNIFKPLSNKLSATSSLMLPASQFEKYLCRWIMMVPLGIILFFVGFIVIEILRCLALMYYIPNFSMRHAWGIITMFGESQSWGGLLALVTFQSFFVLGSALWPKRAAVYTFGWLFLLCIIFGWSAALILQMRITKGEFFISYNEDMYTSTIGNIICVVICLLNYTLAYYRYKEAEIINHW